MLGSLCGFVFHCYCSILFHSSMLGYIKKRNWLELQYTKNYIWYDHSCLCLLFAYFSGVWLDFVWNILLKVYIFVYLVCVSMHGFFSIFFLQKMSFLKLWYCEFSHCWVYRQRERGRYIVILYIDNHVSDCCIYVSRCINNA